MFARFKKKAPDRPAHASRREDWDRMLDEVFAEVVGSWKNGVALVSNTFRDDVGDVRGQVGPRLTFRVREGLDANLKAFIRRMRPEEFAKLHAQASAGEADLARVKNGALPDNSLVYALSGEGGRRALAVFGGALLKEELDRRVALLGQILGRPAGKLPPAPAAPPAAPRAVPGPLTKRMLPKADLEAVKARLNHLEESGDLSAVLKAERDLLKEYLMHKLKESL